MEFPIPAAFQPFNRETDEDRKMQAYSDLLGRAIRSMIEVNEGKEINSLFRGVSPTALGQAFKGLDDFELIAFLVIQEAA